MNTPPTELEIEDLLPILEDHDIFMWDYPGYGCGDPLAEWLIEEKMSRLESLDILDENEVYNNGSEKHDK